MKRRFVRLFFYLISLVIKNIRNTKKSDLYWTLLWLRSGRWMKWHVTSFIFDLLLSPTRGVQYISTTSFSFMFSGKSMSKFGFSMSNFFDFLAEIQSLWNRSCHSSFSFRYATYLVNLLLAEDRGFSRSVAHLCHLSTSSFAMLIFTNWWRPRSKRCIMQKFGVHVIMWEIFKNNRVYLCKK